MDAFKFVCEKCKYVVTSFGDEEDTRMPCPNNCGGWMTRYEAQPIARKWWKFWGNKEMLS